MPVTLKKLASNTATVQIPVGDDSLTVVYFPGRVTEQVYADLSLVADLTNRDVAANAGAINDVLIKLVKSWDLLDDDEQPLPLTMERLAEVPLGFRVEVIDAIFEDMRPKGAATEQTPNLSPSVAG